VSLDLSTVEAWAESVAFEAYGLCGLKPEEFWRLTIPEFQDLVEAATWREARWRKTLAATTLQLLAPYMKEPLDMAWHLPACFPQGDPEDRVTEARERRLRLRVRATDGN